MCSRPGCVLSFYNGGVSGREVGTPRARVVRHARRRLLFFLGPALFTGILELWNRRGGFRPCPPPCTTSVRGTQLDLWVAVHNFDMLWVDCCLFMNSCRWVFWPLMYIFLVCVCWRSALDFATPSPSLVPPLSHAFKPYPAQVHGARSALCQSRGSPHAHVGAIRDELVWRQLARGVHCLTCHPPPTDCCRHPTTRLPYVKPRCRFPLHRLCRRSSLAYPFPFSNGIWLRQWLCRRICSRKSEDNSNPVPARSLV